MRRTAAALTATLLATVLLTGPFASTGQAGPSKVSCAGGSTTPACALLDQLAAQLAPLQPVLALGGPVLGQLAPAVGGLAAQSDQAGGVPTATVTAQAQALLDQLAVLPAPVRAILSAAQLDGLIDTLEALVAELAAPVAGGQTGASTSKPTPAKTGGSTAAPTTSTSSGLPTLGGSLSGADAGSADRGATSPAIPDVPIGDSLTFAPLALPEFGFSPTVGLDPSAYFSPASEAAVAAAEQAIGADMVEVPGDGTTTGLGIVAGLSVLLLGAALAAQVRESRHTIPD